MRFTSAIFAAVALASSALAQTAGFSVMTSPTQDQEIPAGSSFDLIWTPGTPTGPVSIVLLQGETAATLQLGATLASGVPSTLGKFTYSVPTTSPFKTYGFKITLDSDATIFQYSFPFHISGASSSSPSGSATKSTTSPSGSSSISLSGSATKSVHTSSSYSSTVSGVTTSVATPSTTYANSTVISSSATASVPTSFSNSTTTTLLSTTAIATKSSPESTAAGGSATSAAPSVVTKNAAVAKAASAGLALGGLVMAFAL